MAQYNQYISKVPKVNKEMCQSDFWINKDKNSKKPIMTKEEIEKYNKKNISSEAIVDIFSMEEKLHSEEVIELIKALSKEPSVTRYKDGKPLTSEYYEKLKKNLGIHDLKDKIEIKYGLVIRRSNMKTFPTEDRVFKSPEDYDLDRFMETTAYPCEPCAIYCSSSDHKWYLARIYNYLAWIKAEDVAVGSKEKIMEYVNDKDFIVVTGKQVYTGFNPHNKEISLLPLDMGVKLPLAKEEEIEDLVFDMYPCGSYVVKFPLRNEEGKLRFTMLLMSFTEDISLGYLPYNTKNILKQAFKFQGERYGWGGEFFGRDCSGLVLDVYRTFGFTLPRNAGEQLKKGEGIKKEFGDTSSNEYKKTVFDKLVIGSAIFLDGHVGIYLGRDEKEHYMIHDTVGFYVEEGSTKKYLSTKGVVVSPISCIYTSSGTEYLKAIIGVKTFKL
ncbi:NlpC/P60 family protein [Clostridium sp.]|uniref:C40 family peptidase n=1 Tax=Clostridium sp. TaxID=1506 RepID=UPI002FC90BB8